MKTLAWGAGEAEPSALFVHADGWVDMRRRADAMADALATSGFRVARQMYGREPDVPRPETVLAGLRAGATFTAHIGHGTTETWHGCLGVPEREALAAVRPGVFFSVGCSTGIGATICPGVPNSTGSSATLVAAGTTDASDSGTTLFATGIPANQMAMLIVGRGTAQEAVFGSQGTLCLGGSEVARYLPVAPAGPTGFFLKDVSHAGLPFGVPVSIQAGSTWNFQVWYRDMNPDSTSNLSSALSVTFH